MPGSPTANGVTVCQDGVRRCSWACSTPDYHGYHDREWGFPVSADTRLFEKLSLEGFQAGLSWLTILRKRDAFREAFAGFDYARVARFSSRDVERLLANADIVRHRGKIEAVINNAKRAVARWPRGFVSLGLNRRTSRNKTLSTSASLTSSGVRSKNLKIRLTPAKRPSHWS